MNPQRYGLSPVLGYSIAILSTGGALLLTLLLERAQLGPSTRLLFLAAVVVSSWYGGLGPGLFATFLSAAGSIYFFHDIERLSFPTNFNTVRFTEFLVVALLVSWLNAARQRAQGRADEAELECVDGFARFTVTDNGCGIAPEFLPHVFERFRQAQVAHSHSGLGLGLSIVRHFVELHGGTVHASE